jgi:hypothetical protein
VNPQNRAKVEALRQITGYRLGLKEWETITGMLVDPETKNAMVSIETYEVKVLVREDRYTRKGMRVLSFVNGKLADDTTTWDDEFVPYVFEKMGRRKTADEMIEQREWEKMCHRPGNSRFPLDSYERVCDSLFSSTKKMERHF